MISCLLECKHAPHDCQEGTVLLLTRGREKKRHIRLLEWTSDAPCS
jgi:hypothetical protein